MSNNEKIKATHLQRCVYVYVRQSTASQVENNRESTERQYKLVERAISLGWPKSRIFIICPKTVKPARIPYTPVMRPLLPKKVRSCAAWGKNSVAGSRRL